jgi:hypothetical protein
MPNTRFRRCFHSLEARETNTRSSRSSVTITTAIAHYTPSPTSLTEVIRTLRTSATMDHLLVHRRAETKVIRDFHDRGRHCLAASSNHIATAANTVPRSKGHAAPRVVAIAAVQSVHRRLPRMRAARVARGPVSTRLVVGGAFPETTTRNA